MAPPGLPSFQFVIPGRSKFRKGSTCVAHRQRSQTHVHGRRSGGRLLLVGDMLDIAGADVAQCGHKRRKQRLAASEHDQVHLHLLARLSLKAHDRFGCRYGAQRLKEYAQLCLPASNLNSRSSSSSAVAGVAPSRVRCTNPITQVSLHGSRLCD